MSSEPYFGTKARYPSAPSAVASAVGAPAGMTLVHVSLIARHGTRNPTKNSISRMRELERFLRSNVPHLGWLSEWSAVLREYEAEEGALTPAGREEMRRLGRRFRIRYAALLSAPRSTALHARSSSKRRAEHSALAFLDGYRDPSSREPLPMLRVLPEGGDNVVRYTERNATYIDYSVSHKRAVDDIVAAGKEPRAVQIACRIARSLGVPSMRPELVRVVAEAAAFDCAHGRRASSHFLSLLEPADSAFLEGFDRWYRPIINVSHKFRCIAAPLVRDLWQTLLSAKAGRVPPADLKFAHSQTLVPFLILLGIEGNGMKDDARFVPGLVGMCPFAANLAVELFRSSDSRHFSVRFRLQERYITAIPALGEHVRDGGIVPLERLLDFFRSVLDEDALAQKRAHSHQPQGAPTSAPSTPDRTGLKRSAPSAVFMSALMQPAVVASHAFEQRVVEQRVAE